MQQVDIIFVNRAEPLAELYEGVASMPQLPSKGDRIRLPMHPGPDNRVFLCVARFLDFSVPGHQRIRIELDMGE